MISERFEKSSMPEAKKSYMAGGVSVLWRRNHGKKPGKPRQEISTFWKQRFQGDFVEGEEASCIRGYN